MQLCFTIGDVLSKLFKLLDNPTPHQFGLYVLISIIL